jgi:hypothetical protein
MSADLKPVPARFPILTIKSSLSIPLSLKRETSGGQEFLSIHLRRLFVWGITGVFMPSAADPGCMRRDRIFVWIGYFPKKDPCGQDDRNSQRSTIG